MGPSAVFDKSALQALSMDESVWFDSYLMGNVTPLFYVEVLADLEKSVKSGKSPEEVVGMLAFKVPDHSVPNVHHTQIVLQEFAGAPINMSDRPLIAGGKPKRTPDGKLSIHFDEFPEAAALNRWHESKFLEIEREAAKKWRTDLLQHDPDSLIAKLKNIVPAGKRFTDLEELKQYIDTFCEGDYKQLLELALDVLDIPSPAHGKIIERWERAGKPSLVSFVPYSTHVFKVDLLYYLGIHFGFIAGERASNKADMAYLYYLPFCMVFISGDKLHARTAPLFMRSIQRFVPISDLKPALQEIDTHFDSLPDEVKARGVMQFAGYPPSSMNNLVTDLWDTFMRPDWRNIAKEQEAERLNPDGDGLPSQDSLPDILKDVDKSEPLGSGETAPGEDEADIVILKRTMPVHKGKWRMVSKEVEESKPNNRDEQ